MSHKGDFKNLFIFVFLKSFSQDNSGDSKNYFNFVFLKSFSQDNAFEQSSITMLQFLEWVRAKINAIALRYGKINLAFLLF